MKQLTLSPRLSALACLVKQGATVADVGTDHAYLPAWLLQQGVAKFAIASDINQGPLARAKKTAQEYNCTEKMQFYLSNGLDKIPSTGIDTIVIAGMGGETIVQILQGVSWIQDANISLLLQPMSTQPALRRWLWQHGFAMEKECLVKEGETFYQIICARFGNSAPLSCAQEWLGRQGDGQEDLWQEYLLHEQQRLNRAIAGLSKGKANAHAARLAQYQEILAEIARMRGDDKL